MEIEQSLHSSRNLVIEFVKLHPRFFFHPEEMNTSTRHIKPIHLNRFHMETAIYRKVAWFYMYNVHILSERSGCATKRGWVAAVCSHRRYITFPLLLCSFKILSYKLRYYVCSMDIDCTYITSYIQLTV